MTHRHQRRTRSCSLLVIIVILLIVLLVQFAFSKRDPAPVEPPTQTPSPTFVSRDDVAALPTSTPYLDLSPLPTFTLTPTITPTPTLTLTPTPTRTLTATPAPTFFAEIGVELANLREGPGPGYPVIVILGQGEGLLLTARNAAGDWFFARTELGQTGWIFIDTLLFEDDIILLPGRITPTPPPTITPEAS